MFHRNADETVPFAFYQDLGRLIVPTVHMNRKGQVRLNAHPRLVDPFLQSWRSPHVQRLLTAEQRHGAQQPGQTQDVVSMHVADEDAFEFLEFSFVGAQVQLPPSPASMR